MLVNRASVANDRAEIGANGHKSLSQPHRFKLKFGDTVVNCGACGREASIAFAHPSLSCGLGGEGINGAL
jgi:hypothetical protein